MKSNVKLYLSTMVILAVITLGLTSCGSANVSTMLSNEDSNNRVAVATVHVAAIGLSEILKNATDENLRLETIRLFVEPIRFFDDQSGYFYVYYYNCICIANGGDKNLAGKDLSNHQDMKGKFVIRELSTIARNGGGFMDGYWPHPGTKQEQRKIGYVEPIPGTDYFIGTGYYSDTK
jgi:signal transduction histidine kinase